jgi:uncharacterized protein YgbK (DUF1537 family)
MTAFWRILADDLTGALDSAAAFSGPGAVPVFLTTPESHYCHAAAIATATRDLSPAALPSALAPLLPWFTGAGMAFKKIDSLVRGNTFAEISWLVRTGRFERVVFAPAFPAQRRYTRHGRHWVGATRSDPDADSTNQVSLLDGFAREGINARTGTTLAQCAGADVMIPDIGSDDDLAALASVSAEVQSRRWLWCGSAGLAWAIARHWRLSPTVAAELEPKAPVIVATASRHPVLRAQLAHLAAAGIPPAHATSQHRSAGSNLTLLDLADPAPLSQSPAKESLARNAARVVDAQPKPGTLVVIGGDTLLALCKAAGAHALAARAMARSGWGRARLLGGRWDGVQCLSRSGAFGADDDLTTVVASLTLKENNR